MTLRERIEKEIRETGPIPFSRYMELCLYDAQLGYYSKNAEQFGKAGDFYTSSDVHAVFGRLLARQFDEMWRVLGEPAEIEIVELGPGRGLFAQDVLDWSDKTFPRFSKAVRYSLVERSPALRSKLQETLRERFASGKAFLSESLPAVRSAPRIIFANEFFDALPVEVLSQKGELRIALQDGEFVETWATPSDESQEFLDQLGVHPGERERIEVSLAAQRYAKKLAEQVKQGFAVIVDYGYTRAELLEGRHRGTVTAFRQHTVIADPYQAPGEQDITAHVNFSALSASLEQGGMQVQKLLTQSQFLMGIGEENQFADAFSDCHLPQERAKVALQLKHLVTPAGMGENFHALVASKGVSSERVSRLKGINFGSLSR